MSMTSLNSSGRLPQAALPEKTAYSSSMKAALAAALLAGSAIDLHAQNTYTSDNALTQGVEAKTSDDKLGTAYTVGCVASGVLGILLAIELTKRSRNGR